MEKTMGRGKDEFLRRTGGIRPGETSEEFRARVNEIEELEAGFKAGKFKGDELEKVQRRLCELKGISWEYDEEDDDD
jgi:hypothetical protein